jgi:hypothetical protein
MELTEALEKRKLERQKARQALDTILETAEPRPEPINRRANQKSAHGYTSGTFSTIRKIFTTGIKPEEFLTALNPENGTYFGLKTEPTHTTKERLVMFGDTIGEALDARNSFTFQCVNRKERNELAILAATMLTECWIIKLKYMAVRGDLRDQRQS